MVNAFYHGERVEVDIALPPSPPEWRPAVIRAFHGPWVTVLLDDIDERPPDEVDDWDRTVQVPFNCLRRPSKWDNSFSTR